MKAILIQGCKDCPYLVEYSTMGLSETRKLVEKKFAIKCKRGYFETGFSFEKLDIPETPHPNCNLNDLPSIKDAVNQAENASVNVQLTNVAKLGIEFGAGYILNKING
jgi:hypothetical protein